MFTMCFVHTTLSSGELDAPGSKVIATQSSPLLTANPNTVRHDQDHDCLHFGHHDHIFTATPRLNICFGLIAANPNKVSRDQDNAND